MAAGVVEGRRAQVLAAFFLIKRQDANEIRTPGQLLTPRGGDDDVATARVARFPRGAGRKFNPVLIGAVALIADRRDSPVHGETAHDSLR